MAADRRTAAIFDLDGTLFTGHLWQGIVNHHIKHKVNLSAITKYLAAHIPMWLASKFKVSNEEKYKVRWGEDLATTLRGLTREEISKTFEWIYNNYFMKLLRPDVIALLQQHRRERHATVILSGSFNEFLEIIRQRLGADYAVGTKIEVANNICSGKIIKPLCFGMNKAKLLKEFIRQTNLNINLKASFAYADSVADVPVLEMVGKPIATYPDKKLLNLARYRGWQILPCPAMS